MFGAVVAGVAGLMLWLCTLSFRAFSSVEAATVVLPQAAIWIVVTGALFRQYGKVLQRSLARRSLKANALSMTDASSRAILQRCLQSPNASDVLYALSVLDREDDLKRTDSLFPLLDHDSPEVRLEALRRIESGRLGVDDDR